MPRPLSLALALVLSCGIANGVRAEAATSEPMPRNFVAPKNRNAAIRYLFAVAAISPDLNNTIGLVEWKEIGDNIDPAKMPQSFNDVAKLDYSVAIREVTDGSQMSRCNFENNYEAGVNTLIPQLGYLRQLARILRFDARLLQTQGKADEAADRLLTMLRLAAHVKQDGWFINMLVSAAIDQLAFHEIALLAKFPSLSAEKRAELLFALQTRDVPDPLNFQLAIETERRSVFAGVERDAAKPDGPKIIAEMLGDEPGASDIAAMSGEELRKQVAMLQPMYEQFEIALSPVTSDEQAAKIQERVNAGEFGVVAKAFMPGVEGIRRNRDMYKVELAKTIEALKTLSSRK